MSDRRTAIVVGAASGMGAATARVLARDGYALVLADRDAVGVERIAREVEGEHRRGAWPFPLDITDEGAVRRFFDEAVKKLGGRLDAMAVPAGISDHFSASCAPRGRLKAHSLYSGCQGLPQKRTPSITVSESSR